MVNHVAAQTLLMVVVVSVVLGVVGFLYTSPILKLMGVDADVYQNAKGFMQVSFIGMVFSF